MIVCICRVVSERTIQQAITEGASTVEDLSRRCAAGSCCGACVPMLTTMLGRGGASSPDCSPRAPVLKSDPAGGTT